MKKYITCLSNQGRKYFLKSLIEMKVKGFDENNFEAWLEDLLSRDLDADPSYEVMVPQYNGNPGYVPTHISFEDEHFEWGE